MSRIWSGLVMAGAAAMLVLGASALLFFYVMGFLFTVGVAWYVLTTIVGVFR